MRELEQQEAELADSLNAPHLGRGKGKGPYATKVRRFIDVRHKGRPNAGLSPACKHRNSLLMSDASVVQGIAQKGRR